MRAFFNSSPRTVANKRGVGILRLPSDSWPVLPLRCSSKPAQGWEQGLGLLGITGAQRGTLCFDQPETCEMLQLTASDLYLLWSTRCQRGKLVWVIMNLQILFCTRQTNKAPRSALERGRVCILRWFWWLCCLGLLVCLPYQCRMLRYQPLEKGVCCDLDLQHELFY